MHWYLDVLKKYFVFDGRARRAEFWYFVLFNLIVSIVLSVLDNVIGTTMGPTGVGILGTLYALAILLPALGVAVRRLHDTGRTGWWILIGLIPIIGFIILIIYYIQDSQPGENQYGPNPKGA